VNNLGGIHTIEKVSKSKFSAPCCLRWGSVTSNNQKVKVLFQWAQDCFFNLALHQRVIQNSYFIELTPKH
jgi:hypothetical protein